MNRKRQGFLAVTIGAALLAPAAADAASLGRITLQSGRTEPLRAEIQVVMVEPREVGQLSARVASRRLHEESRIPYPAQADQIEAQLEQRGDGSHVIVLRSRQPMTDPMFDLLIELKTPTAEVTRPYLIDTTAERQPAASTAAAGAAANALPDRTAPVSILPEPTSPAPAPRLEGGGESRPGGTAAPRSGVTPATRLESGPAPRLEGGAAPRVEAPSAPRLDRGSARTAPGGSRGSSPDAASGATAAPSGAPAAASPTGGDSASNVRVNAGDTLASIAQSRKTDDVSLDRAMLAIFRANPRAFFGSIHQLKADTELTIPTREAMLSESDAFIARELRRHSEIFQAYKSRVAGAVAPAAQTEAPSGPSGRAGGSEKYDRLVLSKSADGLSPAEEQAAVGTALREANSRIAELQRNLSDLKRLAELKDRQIAQTAATLQKLTGSAVPAGSPSASAGEAASAPTPAAQPSRPPSAGAPSTAPMAAAGSSSAAPGIGAAVPMASPLPPTAPSPSASQPTANAQTAAAAASDRPAGDAGKATEAKPDRPAPMQRIEPGKVRTEAPAEPMFPSWVIYTVVGLLVVLVAVLVRRFMKRKAAEDEFDSELATHHSVFNTRAAEVEPDSRFMPLTEKLNVAPEAAAARPPGGPGPEDSKVARVG